MHIGGNNTVVTIPSFTTFDASNELWSDYWARFGEHSIQEAKQAQVFLTNQTSVTCKLLSNYHCTKRTFPPTGNLLGIYWKRIKPSLISWVNYVFNTYPIDSQGGGNVYFCPVYATQVTPSKDISELSIT